MGPFKNDVTREGGGQQKWWLQIANSIVFTVLGEGGRCGNGHFCGDVIFEWPLWELEYETLSTTLMEYGVLYWQRSKRHLFEKSNPSLKCLIVMFFPMSEVWVGCSVCMSPSNHKSSFMSSCLLFKNISSKSSSSALTGRTRRTFPENKRTKVTVTVKLRFSHSSWIIIILKSTMITAFIFLGPPYHSPSF